MAALVLVVDDEDRIRDVVRRYLEHDGFSVLTASTGADALAMAERARPDLVVLDLRLPDIGGETVLVELRRSRPDVPVVMLTAKASEGERIAGLELGADDYVTKPFSPRELVLRIRAVLRRHGRTNLGSGPVSFGGGLVTIDEDRHVATIRGVAVDLTPTEWRLLTVLAARPGRVVSRFELINRVRGYEYEGYERTVDSHVKNLRRKIELDPHDPTYVLTVPGAGYRFSLDPDPQ